MKLKKVNFGDLGRQKATWNENWKELVGRVGVGKKPLGFLPTPTLPIEKSEFGRLGVGKKPLDFLPTSRMKISRRAARQMFYEVLPIQKL